MWHVCDYFQIEVSSAGLLGERLCARPSSGTRSGLRIEWKTLVAEFAVEECYHCRYFVSGSAATTKPDEAATTNELSTNTQGKTQRRLRRAFI